MVTDARLDLLGSILREDMAAGRLTPELFHQQIANHHRIAQVHATLATVPQAQFDEWKRQP
jgi:hypothetical protein